jgi:hypothetical protein
VNSAKRESRVFQFLECGVAMAVPSLLVFEPKLLQVIRSRPAFLHSPVEMSAKESARGPDNRGDNSEDVGVHTWVTISSGPRARVQRRLPLLERSTPFSGGEQCARNYSSQTVRRRAMADLIRLGSEPLEMPVQRMCHPTSGRVAAAFNCCS